MRTLVSEEIFTRRTWIAAGFVLLLSYFTYVHNFWNPQAFFWDENYHIAAAQKYLNGVYFMEPHPPLAKLIIAAGEWMVGFNEVNDQFIGTDYARDPPPGFSFTGYRLFPTMLAWLTAFLMFLTFLLLTRNHLISVLLSFLYVFDNAMIVHMRGAMLEGPLIFFVVATVLAFLLLLEWKDHKQYFTTASILFGVSFAAVMTTKVNGLILIFLPLALLGALWKERPKFTYFAGLALISFVTTYVAVWHTHFAIGSRVLPSLPDQGYYQASEGYKKILNEGRSTSLVSFPTMIADSWNFVGHYERGVPKLDLCKPDENGSPAFFWPFGARTINYRWETPDSHSYKYLYLQSNPVIWWSGLGAVILGISLLVVSSCFTLKEKLRNRFLLTLFLALYLAYMLVMSMIDRVLYLYHYFLPLLWSFCILAIVLTELPQIGRFVLSEKRKLSLLLGLCTFIFLSFQFYHPFTYYEPITDDAVRLRAFFPLWDLHCVNCERGSPLLTPRPWK